MEGGIRAKVVNTATDDESDGENVTTNKYKPDEEHSEKVDDGVDSMRCDILRRTVRRHRGHIYS